MLNSLGCKSSVQLAKSMLKSRSMVDCNTCGFLVCRLISRKGIRSQARLGGADIVPSSKELPRPPSVSDGVNLLETPRKAVKNPRAASTVAQAQIVPQRKIALDFCLFNDYADYRRFMNGGLAYKALLVDAAGTLIVPSLPTAKVYRDIGQQYGVKYSEDEILARYRRAYAQPWSRSRLRYEADARPFWQHIVKQSTGCEDPNYLEELYKYYTTAEAWHLAEAGAGAALQALREAGVKIAVVSNFDTRLRPLLSALRCSHWFDAIVVSAEVGAEKPNPAIFLAACDLLGVKTEDAVHIGDDRRNDIWGARDAGCDAWLWGEDVHSFKEVAEKIGVLIA
eukprot:c27093_g1_i4 orf=394-1407(+)